MTESFLIKEPATESEWDAYYQLRYEILRKPWGQLPTTTKDEWEDNSLHLIMLNENKEVIGTGRLQFNPDREGQVRSMAIRDDYQGKGLGSRILKRLEEEAVKKKLKNIVLDARDKAMMFYEKNGYTVNGKSYTLFNVIEHMRMEKTL
jgi:N-acetylglutamate synthase-like GNAT family acetyltransferase